MAHGFRIIVAGLLLFIGFSSCERTRDTRFNTLPPSLPALQEGDIAFRRGVGVMSRMVLMADDEGIYSHIGIVIRHEGKWKIVHVVPGEPDFEGDPDRVKMDDPELFFARERAERGALMRLKIDKDRIAEKAARKAAELYSRGILFDHSYDSKDTTQMYCTEFVNYVYRCAGLQLVKGSGHRIPFPGKEVQIWFPGDVQLCKDLKLIYQY